MRSDDAVGFAFLRASGVVLDGPAWAPAACAPLKAIATARLDAYHDELTLFGITSFFCGAALKAT
ncbi:MAG TPA: hypothetical protein VH277_19930 [Gemmatimonadaceae bacterium]|nr:hypothetical protein [Gemmatimonadaceae bacterium]